MSTAIQTNSKTGAPTTPNRTLDAEWLRQLCLDAGADDVGFVEIDREELSDQRDDILAVNRRRTTASGKEGSGLRGQGF